ncbi:MerR family DNA-binding protein [Shinella sumterensis]|uniref:MerR family DNA-binding protein n=1 Tax=Rhizobiaceae TaxID=82115 RepID=UPI001FDF3822|nr:MULTISPECIES: MerR family DNA-binding protein [Rhizobiaceae]WLS10027.1 MerR family DNA-binding protein [Shinella sumterensis]
MRYYEDIGLLPRPGRTAIGRRSYDAPDLCRVTFVRRCRDFEFSIDKVRLLINLSTSADRDGVEARDITQARLDEVRSKLTERHAQDKRLAGFIQRCSEVMLEALVRIA